MQFKIEELSVIFPYDKIYKEQLEYMTELKHTLDQSGHAILEMPTGTGKTISLLALIIAYLANYPQKIKKLIYCTRTVVEMEKTLEEVRKLLDVRRAILGQDFGFLAVGLSARRNLCIHPEVAVHKEKDKVDARCRSLTAHWVQEQKAKQNDVQTCQYFDNFNGHEDEITQSLQSGVYSLGDLRKFGAENLNCPYFLARKLISKANIVVYNYLYLLDPSVASLLSKEHAKESVVVFDEAHNIDDVCIEAYTVRLNKPMLMEASNNIERVAKKLQDSRENLQQRLAEEYNRLLQGLSNNNNLTKDNTNSQNNQEQNQQQQVRVVPIELKDTAIPGNIRQASHFVDFMRRLVRILRQKLKSQWDILGNQNSILLPTSSFLEDIMKEGLLDRDALKTCGERLQILLNTLQISEIDQFSALQRVTQFTQYLSSFSDGFKIVFQINHLDSNYDDKLMTLACFDSSLGMKYVFSTFNSVILTSGTMSPLEIYPKILDFKPVVCTSINIDLVRNSICPLIVTMAEDGTQLSSEFDKRNNEDISRNYGAFMVELSETVPDGLIVFMPSYSRMEEWARVWEKDKYLEQVSRNKLLFIESKDVAETSLVKQHSNPKKIQHYKQACDIGRGASLFAIARGKIAEGIDFEHHYGRCVAIVGFPALNSKDILILERCKFLEERFKITKNDFIEFDAMRQTSQCLGRVMRAKDDYGIMILADKRFAQKSKLTKMPRWIAQNLEQSSVDITSQTAITIVRDFYRRMAQKFQLKEGSFFTQEMLSEKMDVEQ